MTATRYHYYMAAGHVVFDEKETGHIVASRTYNTLIKLPAKQLALRHISDLQKALYMRTLQEIDQTKVITKDTVITGIFYLGHFSQSEFDAQVNLKPDDKPKVDIRMPELIQ